MFLSKEDTLKGLECCSEFLCGECPYKVFEDKKGEYIIRCMYKLMNDNLCISCGINSYLERDILSDELMDILHVEELPADMQLLKISKTKYKESEKCYEKLILFQEN